MRDEKKRFPPKGAPRADREGGDSERIAKRLARAGVASRRDAEALISAGRITVNGTVLASPAFNVSAGDRIELDGTPIPAIERTRLFLFHKPAGLVTTNRDPQGRRTVFDALPKELPRLMTVGRLDINTEGLLLLTNDGGLARTLELPATGWLRRYRVRVHGRVEQEALAGLAEGTAVGGVFYGAVEAVLDREQGSNAWLTIGLREGKNREVKNILGALGLEVTRLIRVSYGPFQLGVLGEGEVQELRGRHLRDQLGERLIRESGANFDAPVARELPKEPRGAAPVKEPAAGRGSRPEGRKEREARREDLLKRLDTKPRGERKAGPGKPRAAKPGGREERREAPPPRSRASNVWMAPGARPEGRKKQEAEPRPAGREGGERAAGKPRPGKPHAGKPQGKARSGPGRPGGAGKDRPRRPAKARPGGNADRRR